MLVLSRKQGQRIVIGTDIVITVLDGQGDRVRLGISAPAETPINREEVFNRIKQEASADQTQAYREESAFFVECG
jgi:carbon storage regulator